MKNDDRGSLLIMTFFIVIALATILTAASLIFVGGKRGGRAFGGTQAVGTNVASLQAHYIAEMGIEDVLSDPSKLTSVLQGEKYNSPEPVYLGSRDQDGSGNIANIGEYQVVGSLKGDIIELQSTAYVENQKTIAQKTITCKFRLSSEFSFMLNAIVAGQVSSGKVDIQLNQGQGSANIYSKGDLTIATTPEGRIPGSIIAQGNVTINGSSNDPEQITLTGDVITQGTITLNRNAKISGNVIAYSNEAKSVTLNNNVEVKDIYTQLGEGQVITKNNVTYNAINTIENSAYPSTFETFLHSLPTIDEQLQERWITQAKSENNIINGKLELGNGQTETIGNTFVNGDLILNQNSTLNIKEGSIVYVTGHIEIENNATVKEIDVNNDNTILYSLVATEKRFVIANNAIPTSITLVALGDETSELQNNSGNTVGAILVPNGELKIKNNAKITFNPEANQFFLSPANPITADDLELESWQEGEQKSS